MYKLKTPNSTAKLLTDQNDIYLTFSATQIFIYFNLLSLGTNIIKITSMIEEKKTIR